MKLYILLHWSRLICLIYIVVYDLAIRLLIFISEHEQLLAQSFNTYTSDSSF